MAIRGTVEEMFDTLFDTRPRHRRALPERPSTQSVFFENLFDIQARQR